MQLRLVRDVGGRKWIVCNSGSFATLGYEREIVPLLVMSVVQLLGNWFEESGGL